MSEHEELMSILKAPAELVRFLPMRVVLRKSDEGVIEGLCEESFSMGWYEYNVRIWWSGIANGVFKINGIDDAGHQAKEGDLIFDPLAEDCPIEIDWAHWLSTTSKFGRRNAPFKTKGG